MDPRRRGLWSGKMIGDDGLVSLARYGLFVLVLLLQSYSSKLNIPHAFSQYPIQLLPTMVVVCEPV